MNEKRNPEDEKFRVYNEEESVIYHLTLHDRDLILNALEKQVENLKRVKEEWQQEHNQQDK